MNHILKSAFSKFEEAVKAYVKPSYFLHHEKSTVDLVGVTAEELKVNACNAILLRMKQDYDQEEQAIEKKTLQELVNILHPYIIDDDPQTRKNAVILLGNVIMRCTSIDIPNNVVESIIALCACRLYDWYSVEGCMLIYLGLLTHHNTIVHSAVITLNRNLFDSEIVECNTVSTQVIPSDDSVMMSLSCGRVIIETILKHVHAPGFSQPIRNNILQILSILLSDYSDDIYALRHRAVTGIFCQVENEKDPRNLILSFPIMEQIIKNYHTLLSEEEQHLDLIADIMLSYFPIRFKPPANDPYKVTEEDLKKALLNCLISNELLATRTFDVLLDVLNDGLTANHTDDVEESLLTISYCIKHFSKMILLDYIQPFFEVIKLSSFSTTCPFLSSLSMTFSTVLQSVIDNNVPQQVDNVLVECCQRIIDPTLLHTSSDYIASTMILIEAAKRHPLLLNHIWDILIRDRFFFVHFIDHPNHTHESVCVDSSTLSLTTELNLDKINRLKENASSFVPFTILDIKSSSQKASFLSIMSPAARVAADLDIMSRLVESLSEMSERHHIVQITSMSLCEMYDQLVTILKHYVDSTRPDYIPIGIGCFDVMGHIAIELQKRVATMSSICLTQDEKTTFYVEAIRISNHCIHCFGHILTIYINPKDNINEWQYSWRHVVEQAIRLEPDIALSYSSGLIYKLMKRLSVLIELSSPDLTRHELLSAIQLALDQLTLFVHNPLSHLTMLHQIQAHILLTLYPIWLKNHILNSECLTSSSFIVIQFFHLFKQTLLALNKENIPCDRMMIFYWLMDVLVTVSDISFKIGTSDTVKRHFIDKLSSSSLQDSLLEELDDFFLSNSSHQLQLFVKYILNPMDHETMKKKENKKNRIIQTSGLPIQLIDVETHRLSMMYHFKQYIASISVLSTNILQLTHCLESLNLLSNLDCLTTYNNKECILLISSLLPRILENDVTLTKETEIILDNTLTLCCQMSCESNASVMTVNAARESLANFIISGPPFIVKKLYQFIQPLSNTTCVNIASYHTTTPQYTLNASITRGWILRGVWARSLKISPLMTPSGNTVIRTLIREPLDHLNEQCPFGTALSLCVMLGPSIQQQLDKSKIEDSHHLFDLITHIPVIPTQSLLELIQDELNNLIISANNSLLLHEKKEIYSVIFSLLTRLNFKDVLQVIPLDQSFFQMLMSALLTVPWSVTSDKSEQMTHQSVNGSLQLQAEVDQLSGNVQSVLLSLLCNCSNQLSYHALTHKKTRDIIIQHLKNDVICQIETIIYSCLRQALCNSIPQVRQQALHCLYHMKGMSDTIFEIQQYQFTVCERLRSVLNDPRYIIRRSAAICTNYWMS